MKNKKDYDMQVKRFLLQEDEVRAKEQFRLIAGFKIIMWLAVIIFMSWPVVFLMSENFFSSQNTFLTLHVKAETKLVLFVFIEMIIFFAGRCFISDAINAEDYLSDKNNMTVEQYERMQIFTSVETEKKQLNEIVSTQPRDAVIPKRL